MPSYEDTGRCRCGKEAVGQSDCEACSDDTPRKPLCSTCNDEGYIKTDPNCPYCVDGCSYCLDECNDCNQQ